MLAAHARIFERRRLGGILFRLDHGPAFVAEFRQQPSEREEIDAAVARHRVHALQHRAQKACIALTHALEDPYNFDHANAAHFAQETRVVAQAMGHKPDAKYKYAAPPVFLFEPHQPEMCNYKPNLILKIDEVWEQKYKAFQILAAQKHLWGYYERVALNRGIQGSRNTGVPMTYGEAYQRLFPTVEEILK